MEHYIERHAYDHLVTALANSSDPENVKLILGEFGNLWPETVRDDSEVVIEAIITDRATGLRTRQLI